MINDDGSEIMHGLLSWRDYRSGDAVCYWRSPSGYEVDFIPSGPRLAGPPWVTIRGFLYEARCLPNCRFFSIGRVQYIKHQFPNPFILPDGTRVHKPAEW